MLYKDKWERYQHNYCESMKNDIRNRVLNQGKTSRFGCYTATVKLTIEDNGGSDCFLFIPTSLTFNFLQNSRLRRLGGKFMVNASWWIRIEADHAFFLFRRSFGSSFVFLFKLQVKVKTVNAWNNMKFNWNVLLNWSQGSPKELLG